MTPRRSAIAAVVLLAAFAALHPGAALAATVDVDVADNSFQPRDVTVDEGDTVLWSQSGTRPHTVTADDGSFDSAGGGSATMSQGSTFSHVFGSAGTFRYYCKIHGGPGGVGMSGTVTVRAAQAPTTTTAAPATTTTAAPATTTTAAPRVAGTSVELPRTGTPLAALAVAGVALVVTGRLLTRPRRRRVAEDV